MSRVKKALEMVAGANQLGKYDSNVIGMAAEVIAEDHFRMVKAARGSKDIDGSWFQDGKDHTVQVKAWSEDRVKRYRRGTYLRLYEDTLPDVLLCLLVYCSRPHYEVLYVGSPRAVGQVKLLRGRPTRVIRLADMKTKDESESILQELGIENLRRSAQPKGRVGDSTGDQKSCSICGVTFPIEEFHYGGRTTNSYCTSCCKLHSQAYARGGSEATRRFREEMRAKWKN